MRTTILASSGVKCGLTYSAYNWTCDTRRTLTANGIPDIDVTDGSCALSSTVSNASGTFLNKTASGYVLNGVKFDPGTARSISASTDERAGLGVLPKRRHRFATG